MLLKFFVIIIVMNNIYQHSAAASNKKNVVCYHGTWATYRPALGKYDVTDIDPFLCTHLMYAFFGIEESGELRIIDPYLDLEENWGRGNIKKFNALKLQNPTLKTLAAVGGWNEGSKNFSIVAADPTRRGRFVNSAVRFIQRHGFDGLDLDWEYPGQRHKLDNDDRSNFINLLKELREGLEPFGYMLTAAVGSAEFSASISYDIPKISLYLDLINVMSYDLNGAWSNLTGINAPLYEGDADITSHQKQLNVDAIMKYWLNAGAPREKLVLGVPFYGRTFTLGSSLDTVPGSPHLGRGIAGPYSQEPGVIGYNELCEKMLHESWTVLWEPKQMVPYAYLERQWVSFESVKSLELKAQYAMDHDLGGIMVWSLESDDFRGICNIDTERYPLLKQINRVLFVEGSATGLKQKVSGGRNYLSDSIRSPNPKCLNHTGYVRDEENYSKFVYCSEEGLAYNFECPHPLNFDPATSNCNYAATVEC